MLEEVSLEESGELDRFVTAHPQGQMMQTSIWGRFKSDWAWRGLLSRRKDGTLRGSMALLIHCGRYLPFCMLYAPRGPVFDRGDWAALDELLEGAGKVAAEQNGYLLRVDPPYAEGDREMERAFRERGFQINPISDFSAFQARMNYLLPLSGNAEEQLARCAPKTRYNIRLAQRRGITVQAESQSSLEEFYGLLECSARRDGFSLHPAAYYARFLEIFGDSAHLYLARKDGHAAAGALCVCRCGRTRFVAGGYDGAYSRDMAGYLLQWTAISEALERGCNLYDFGGVEGYPTERNAHCGLHRFKAGFGAEFQAYLGQMDFPYHSLVSRAMKRLTR